MKCSECGFTIWAKQDYALGAHLECVSGDPSVDTQDLEEQLDEALKGTK